MEYLEDFPKEFLDGFLKKKLCTVSDLCKFYGNIRKKKSYITEICFVRGLISIKTLKGWQNVEKEKENHSFSTSRPFPRFGIRCFGIRRFIFRPTVHIQKIQKIVFMILKISPSVTFVIFLCLGVNIFNIIMETFLTSMQSHKCNTHKSFVLTLVGA